MVITADFLRTEVIEDRLPNIIESVGLGILGGLLLLTLIVGAVSAFRNPPKKANDFNIRVYTYTYDGKKEYSFFDRSDMKNRKTYTEEQFYEQFAPSERYRVKDWLAAVAQNQDYPTFIEAEIRMRKNNQTMATMLELTGVDRKKDIIHFESHLIPYMGKIPMAKGKKKKTIKVPKNYILESPEEMQRFVDDAQSNLIIGFIYLKLYRLGSGGEEEDASLIEESQQIRNIVYRFLGKNMRLYVDSPTSEVVIDRSASSRPIVMNIATAINTALQQHLNFDVPDDNLRVAIGVSLGVLCERKADVGLSQGKQMADAIITSYPNEHVLLFDPDLTKKTNVEEENLKDVVSVLRNGTYRLYFQPTLNIKTGSQSFYFLHVLPYGTKMTNFRDLLDLANKIPWGLPSAYGELKERVSKGISKVNNSGVLIEIPYSQIKTFLTSMGTRKESDLDWIVGLRESELLTYLDDISSLRRNIEKIMEAGYKIALFLSNAETLLPNSILRFCSYFIVEVDRLDPSDLRITADLRIIATNYSLYPGELVYAGLPDLDKLELCVHYNGTIFECKALRGPSSHPEILDPEQVSTILSEARAILPKGVKDQKDLYDSMKRKESVIRGLTSDKKQG